MTFLAILKLPIRVFSRHFALVLMALIIIAGSSFYPSDLKGDYAVSKGGNSNIAIVAMDKYGRHLNTLVPIATALILKDTTGLKQIGAITIAGIVASHGPKRLLNDVEIMGTRLGQRPYSPKSKHNTPSGHSTLASAGAYFIMRRYSIWFGLIVIPVALVTMYARVMLDMHTVSSVIAGGFTGMLVAALFSTKFSSFVKVARKRLGFTNSNKHIEPAVPFSKLLPNIITIFGICLGLTAIKMALQGNVAIALYMLVFAMILDAVDGRLARALNSESKIGAELDTLADFFNFGIATPLILYVSVFSNSDSANLGWVAVMVFTVCCAMRLARFNVGLSVGQSQTNFIGVPAPALACLGLSPLFLIMLGVDVTEYYAIPAMMFIMLCGFLAVGTFPTVSLKTLTIPASLQLVVFLGAALLMISLIMFPWHTLLVGNAAYLLTIPVFALSQNALHEEHR